MTYAIDTHASIKRLADAGVPNNQAEALVELMAQQHEDVATKADIATINDKMATMATKIDLAEVKTDIAAINDKITTLQSNMATKIDLAEVKADIAALQSATKADIAEMKTQLLNSMIALGGVMIALGGVMIATIKLL